MAATVNISESNGAVATVTDAISNMNFGTADIPNLIPASHPIPLLNAAVNYSYTKWLRVHLAALGGSTQIATLKVWKSSGALVTGEVVGTNSAQPLPVANQTNIPSYGHKMVAVGGGVVSPMPYIGQGGGILNNDWNSFPAQTSQPANVNIPIAASDTGILNAPGYSDYTVWCEYITQATPAGAVNQKIITFQYNET